MIEVAIWLCIAALVPVTIAFWVETYLAVAERVRDYRRNR